jgi:metal-responsive CopG/Arc/MetJ family transcriptional regulator
MQRISITIEDTLKEELDNIVAKGERASFINLAIKKAVDDWHKQQALEKILAFKPYKIEQDSIEVLREIRESRVQQVIEATRE